MKFHTKLMKININFDEKRDKIREQRNNNTKFQNGYNKTIKSF